MTKISEKKDTFSFPSCNTCKHKLKGVECIAFKRIPIEILTGDNNHKKPLKGQKNEIVFEKIKEIK
jgi:hypothetical protein